MKLVNYIDAIEYSYQNHLDLMSEYEITSKIITRLAQHCVRRNLNYIKKGNIELRIDNHLTCVRCCATKLWFPVYGRLNGRGLFGTGLGVTTYDVGNIKIAKDIYGKLIALSKMAISQHHIKECPICHKFYYSDMRNINRAIDLGGYEHPTTSDNRTVQGYSYINGDFDTYYDVCWNCQQHYLDDPEYCQCEGCGMILREDETRYFEPYSCVCCEDCYSANEERWEQEQEDNDYYDEDDCDDEWGEISCINDYHEGNHEQLDLGDKLMFGAEYEILCFNLYDDSTDRKNFCHGLNEFGAITRDSSVDLEIVTEPLTLPDLRKRILDLADFCGQHHVRAWDGNKCGLHIHINRGGINNIENIYYFLNVYRKPLLKLSGRTDTHYCEFDFPARKEELHERCTRYSRYLAVNLCNENTVEFRFLRNTTNRERLEAYFDFLEALFANEDKLRDMTWDDLIRKTDNDFLYRKFNIPKQYPLPLAE